jgi:cytochrome oxidase Cu insertion factor (SCO1/SenC/PrrC family)
MHSVSRKILAALTAIVLFWAAGCATPAATPTALPSTATLATAPPAPPIGPTVTTVAQAALPKWQTATLVDARNGTTFTLADFKGKTVYVEPMATWCTNCRAQLTNVKAVMGQIADPDNYVFIGLSVETDLKPEDLGAYVQRTGFDWRFAVMTPDLLAELSSVFGRAIANPPSTPHFVIYPDGTTSELKAGSIESTDELIKMLTVKNS